MTSPTSQDPLVHAKGLDAEDALSHMRREFLIPSKAQLKAKSLPDAESRDASHDAQASSIYLCGNSLGLQPRITSVRMQQYLSTWATQGVYGHFKPLAESSLPVWLDADAKAAEGIAPIVGALPTEVAVMQTLTANLHFLMSAFYKPDVHGRHKIIIEIQAFPSDHFVAESQIRHHGLDPSSSLVTIRSSSETQSTLPTSHILSAISEHGASAALLLLPGIQYYTGQLLDIPTITAAAHDAGIFVIWDLAHAVGNVELQLHDWHADAAAWCSYKYLNAGPGSIGGLFVHEKHSQVSATSSGEQQQRPQKKEYVNRLSGWWGSDKASRFAMDNHFVPMSGAAGFQLSNPSIYDITSVNASLELFQQAGGMGPLRQRSLRLTAYLESRLTAMQAYASQRFAIITPRDPAQRGAQLSLRLEAGLLDVVMKELEERGVVVDERRPDVIRVAPAPLYNTFADCGLFVVALEEAVDVAVKAKKGEIQARGTDKFEVTS